jgi:hypothetical protein
MACALLPFLQGCSRRNTTIALPEATERGFTSMEFITEPRSDIPAGQELQPPRPKDELALPQYPPEALAAQTKPTTVFLRFVINENGNVTEIKEIPNMPAPAGPFAAAFLTAAEQAVRSWEFHPAEWQWLADGRDLNGDGHPDYRRLLKTERIPVYLDVRFDFEIVAGKGRIQIGNPPRN